MELKKIRGQWLFVNMRCSKNSAFARKKNRIVSSYSYVFCLVQSWRFLFLQQWRIKAGTYELRTLCPNSESAVNQLASFCVRFRQDALWEDFFDSLFCPKFRYVNKYVWHLTQFIQRSIIFIVLKSTQMFTSKNQIA